MNNCEICNSKGWVIAEGRLGEMLSIQIIVKNLERDIKRRTKMIKLCVALFVRKIIFLGEYGQMN
jgi:hypothetical protein